MWLSRIVKKGRETKSAFREIEKLIRAYSDPTNINQSKFWIIDIGRFFKPNAYIFLILFLVISILNTIFFLIPPYWEISILNDWNKSGLAILVPILVLGITFANVAKNLSNASRFASDYLKDSCKMPTVACIAFLSILYGYFASMSFSTVDKTLFLKVIFVLFSSFTIAGTIWCLVSLIYITIQITRCTHPETSIRAASYYATRKLGHAFLIEVYNAAWMGNYNSTLAEKLKELKNIRPFDEYWSTSLIMTEKSENKSSVTTVCEIKLPKKIDFHFGYRDYNISKLKKIDYLLKSKQTELYLTPHGFDNKQFGLLLGTSREELSATIYKSIHSIYKFRKDKYTEEAKEFWKNNYFKLRDSLFKSSGSADISQFQEYIKSIGLLYEILRKARKHELVKKYESLDYKKTRYLHLYIQSVKWILENKELEEDIKESFLEVLVDSVEHQVAGEIKSGDRLILGIFTWLIPSIYQLFPKKNINPRLWELRGRVGGFYGDASYLLADSEYHIDEESKIQIQLTLHKGIIRWLLLAIEEQDHELIKSLCTAARQLVFPDKKVVFKPSLLISQHFILCGKIIEFLMDNKEGIDPLHFQLLFVDEYDHLNYSHINFKELVDFFIESRHSDYSHFCYEFSSTDWERDPLMGGGYGTPKHTFQGNIELDYMFIYLSLSVIFLLENNPEPISFEFWGYSLPDKIEKFRSIASKLELYRFSDSKTKLEEWLRACDSLYKQEQEEYIATAIFNDELVFEYKNRFWEGYKSVSTFLAFCIKKRYCYISEEKNPTKRYSRSKSSFIGINNSSIQSIAKLDGQDLAQYYDKRLLKDLMVCKSEDETGSATSILAQFDQACDWLIEQNTNKDTGIIVFYGNAFIESELYKSGYYEPSHESQVFSGYYKNFPLIKVFDQKTSPTCGALDLKAWGGLKVKKELLESDIWGNIEIREWTDAEIDEAITNNQLKASDRNKAKGQCPIEYELFWSLDKDSLPHKKIITLEIPSQAGGKQSETEMTNH